MAPRWGTSRYRLSRTELKDLRGVASWSEPTLNLFTDRSRADSQGRNAAIFG